MDKLQVFQSSEFGELGILVVDGKEYFPATECAAKLGYTNPQKAVRDHCKGCTKRSVLTAGGTQTANFIPEGDLYRLIIRSKLPAAERFETWVFDEVLPSIRKTGAYSNQQADYKTQINTLEFLVVSQQHILDLQRRVFALERASEGSAAESPVTADNPTAYTVPPTNSTYTDYHADLLLAVYRWAQGNKDRFFSLGHECPNPLDCPGRWDKGEWGYIAFYPDVLRGLLRTRFDQSDPNAVLLAWRNRGWLKTNKRENRTTSQVRMPKGTTRMIVIKHHPLRMVSQARSE